MLRVQGSSPHTRGAHHRQHRHGHRLGIIPAYAGSTSIEYWSESSYADHPRIRGEHRRPHPNVDRIPGSSPHTRGALVTSRVALPTEPDHPRIRGEHHRVLVPRICEIRIIPAYAGSTLACPKSSRNDWDHPRIRGEHVTSVTAACAPIGSSPHTRGAPLRPLHRGRPIRIIPAYAGSTSRSRRTALPIADHPRIRGEHSSPSPTRCTLKGSSPHTRGARDYDVLFPARLGIIPAYAGSTCTSRRRGVPKWDHPRIRGEHLE